MKEAVTVLNSEPLKELTTPVFHEIGGMLGDAANMMQFYLNRNMEKIGTEWAASRKQKPLQAEEVERVLPLLPLAATVSDSELQKRWAALLETAARAGDAYFPSFGHTLSQVTSEEARYLSSIWDRVRLDVPHPRRMYDLSIRELLTVHHPDIDPNLVWYRYPPDAKDRPHEAEIGSLTQRYDKVKEMTDDLVRLSIVEMVVEERPRYFELDRHKIPVLDNPQRKVTYKLSAFGENFVRAVTPRDSE